MNTKESDYVTKDYLDTKLAELRLEIMKYRLETQEKLNEQFRWNVGLIFGLYAMIAIGYFIK